MDPETTEKEVNSYYTPWKLESKRHDTRTFCLIIINNWVFFTTNRMTLAVRCALG